MKHINATELDHKIKSFLGRKTCEYPELMSIKKAAWTRTGSHAIAARFLSV